MSGFPVVWHFSFVKGALVYDLEHWGYLFRLGSAIDLVLFVRSPAELVLRLLIFFYIL
jgi:hypothetical protein